MKKKEKSYFLAVSALKNNRDKKRGKFSIFFRCEKGKEYVMRIVEQIKEKQNNLYARKPITIAFLGDSVTQGCFECYEPYPGGIETDFIAKHAYCERVKQILNKLYPSVPFAIVNAGTSGGSALSGLQRLDRDVLSYDPDLVVVCFGLNDSGDGEKGIEKFYSNLREIFAKIKAKGSECIFMTPNTLNDRESPKLTNDLFKNLAKEFAERMQNGVMDGYAEAGKRAAKDEDVAVCDCYALWKQMQRCGVNVTELLSNKLNHPDKEMQYLFAYELVKTMLQA